HTPGYAKGGTQSSGGAGEVGHSATGMPGSFGAGGNASGEAAGGGGAGWYGGGGSGNCGGADDEGGGAGGSSYMSNTLTNTKTIAGSASLPAPQGGNETGHAGNGYARITLVK
ncbi:MAG: fimbrillin family protein, partial [Proteobacteria bacterium]|nr:fimbrillin family protein [Pseudomonadota bacterium]